METSRVIDHTAAIGLHFVHLHITAMKLTYFGHSTFQVTTGSTTVLVDPFLTGNPHASGIVTPDALNPDVILLTHAHEDHWGDTLTIAQRTGALVVANFEITNYVHGQGHTNVQSLNTGGTWTFDWGSVTQTYARHSSSFPDGTYGGNPNGYLICAEGKCIYNTGDTDVFSEMAWIGEDHDVDVMLMPVGDCFTMGIAGSVRAARLVQAKLNIPMHYGTFPPIDINIDDWSATMRQANLPSQVLAAGEHLTL